jgi:hypothetical protein
MNYYLEIQFNKIFFKYSIFKKCYDTLYETFFIVLINIFIK